MDAVDYGVSALQCASGAVADGISNPPSLRVVQNLRALGHSVPVDTEALTEVNHFFTRIAAAEGLPSGAPQAFDAAYLRHQLPGGMISLGGNIYFLAKLFATDGRSFQYVAAQMAGMSQADYAKMMLEGGRVPEG